MAFRALLLVIAMLFALAEPTEAQVGPTRVNANLNLRNGPGTQFQALLVIPNGGAVQLLGCTGDWSWCNVRYQGVVGWVATRFLVPQPAGSLPPPSFPPPVPLPGPSFPVPLPLPFPVPPGQVAVTGTLTNQGAECRTMRGDNGQIYSLVGKLGGFRPGDRVRVRGRIAEMSFCMQGTTIEIRSIRPAN